MVKVQNLVTIWAIHSGKTTQPETKTTISTAKHKQTKQLKPQLTTTAKKLKQQQTQNSNSKKKTQKQKTDTKTKNSIKQTNNKQKYQQQHKERERGGEQKN